MRLQNLTDTQREKFRKVKNCVTLTTTIIISIILGRVLVFYDWPRHWEIVNGELRMVFSGFTSFTRENWVMLIGGILSIGFLFGVFALSLKYPLLAGTILFLISVPFFFIFIMVIGDVDDFLDILFWVGVFLVGVLLLVSSILNLGFQSKPKSR